MTLAGAPDPVEGRGWPMGEVVNLDAVRKRRGSREAGKAPAAAVARSSKESITICSIKTENPATNRRMTPKPEASIGHSIT